MVDRSKKSTDEQPEQTSGQKSMTTSVKSKEPPKFVRRSFLKGITAVGVSATGISSLTTSVAAKAGNGSLQMVAPFLKVELTVNEPPNAILHSNDRLFPKSIEAESSIYLPLGPHDVFDRGLNENLVETSHGVQLNRPGREIAQDHLLTDRGRFLAGGNVKDRIQLKSNNTGVAKLQFGSETLRVKATESKSYTKDVPVSYETLEGTRSENLQVQMDVTNYGRCSIITHPGLVVIPKGSPGGEHLNSVVRPELKQKGHIGNLTDIKDLGSIDAWGLQLRTGGDQ